MACNIADSRRHHRLRCVSLSCIVWLFLCCNLSGEETNGPHDANSAVHTDVGINKHFMHEDVLSFIPPALYNTRAITEIDYSPFAWKNTFIIVHQLKQLEKSTHFCFLLIYIPQVYFLFISLSWLIIYLTQKTMVLWFTSLATGFLISRKWEQKQLQAEEQSHNAVTSQRVIWHAILRQSISKRSIKPRTALRRVVNTTQINSHITALFIRGSS